MKSLAIDGGAPVVTSPHPHCVWPPPADQAELDEIARQRNLDIGIRGRVGPIEEFEDRFLGFLSSHVDYAVTFNSGTSALLAAYVAIGLSEGDEIIGPCLTYHAALSPAFVLGARVVLCDVDLDTRCIDVKQLSKKITGRTKAITVVHQWGHPADMDPIMHIARAKGISVIEDCSHAHGSRYGDALCGTIGDIGVFSLQTNKAIFAGEGGILVTSDSHLRDRATLLGHYRDRSRETVSDPELRKYWVSGFGQKLRMSPFNAIVAKHALAKFTSIQLGRNRCLSYFNEGLRRIRFIRTQNVIADGDMGAWYGFKPLFVSEQLPGVSRDRLVEVLTAEGLEVSAPSGHLLSRLPLYSEGMPWGGTHKSAADISGPFPNAEVIQESALSLPTFYNWPKHRTVIDQYLAAFEKVEREYLAIGG